MQLKRQLTEKQALLDQLSATAAMPPLPEQSALDPSNFQQTPPEMMGVAGEPIDEEQAVLAQLISYLASQTQEEQHDALFTVAEMVSYAYGDDGARIGEMMRSQGGLTQLTWILSDPQQPLDVQQQVLLLLGNLCSDSVDPASMLSKRYLLNMGVEGVLFSFLQSDDTPTLIFTCGAVQNLCHDTEWSARALGHGVDRQLTALLGHEDSNVVKYAAGALKNISSTTQTELASEQKGAIELRAREVAVQAFSERRAYRKISKFAANIPSDVRLRRMLTARGIIDRAANAFMDVSAKSQPAAAEIWTRAETPAAAAAAAHPPAPAAASGPSAGPSPAPAVAAAAPQRLKTGPPPPPPAPPPHSMTAASTALAPAPSAAERSPRVPPA